MSDRLAADELADIKIRVHRYVNTLVATEEPPLLDHIFDKDLPRLLSELAALQADLDEARAENERLKKAVADETEKRKCLGNSYYSYDAREAMETKLRLDKEIAALRAKADAPKPELEKPCYMLPNSNQGDEIENCVESGPTRLGPCPLYDLGERYATCPHNKRAPK